jgi:hypothetical protein
MSAHLSYFPDFESAADRALGIRVRASDQDACAVWCALANIQWRHVAEDNAWDGWTFRSAGCLIERLRGNEDCGGSSPLFPAQGPELSYMNWYCCGVDGRVAPWIAEAMAKEGWVWRNYPKRQI